MDELQRVQALRVDEFSRRILIENQDTINQFTSQLQELQDYMNCMSYSGECQDVESIRIGQLSHVPSQLAVVPSPRGMLSRDQSLRSDVWNSPGTSGNVFAGPSASFSTNFTGMLHP